MSGGIVGVRQSHGIVSAIVQYKAIAQGEQPTLFIEAKLNVVDLVAAVGGADKMFSSIFDPFDRPAQLQSQKRNKNFFRIDEYFGTESAADIRRNDATALQRRGAIAVVPEALAQYMGRCAQRLLGISFLDAEAEHDVIVGCSVDERRARG